MSFKWDYIESCFLYHSELSLRHNNPDQVSNIWNSIAISCIAPQSFHLRHIAHHAYCSPPGATGSIGVSSFLHHLDLIYGLIHKRGIDEPSFMDSAFLWDSAMWERDRIKHCLYIITYCSKKAIIFLGGRCVCGWPDDPRQRIKEGNYALALSNRATSILR